jgi:hypothetical protein
LSAVTEVPRTEPEFVNWLVDRHPGLAPVLKEHLAVYDELLPHVFFGDVTRYASVLAHESTETVELDRLLADLDNALAGGTDDEVENLVWASFIENAQGVAGDDGEKLRMRLRPFPNLARALDYE